MAFLLEGGARKTWAAEKLEFDKKAKLERFRKLYEKKLVKYWRNKDDLAGKVAMANRRYDRGLSGGPPLVFAAVKQKGVARECRAEPQAKKGRAMEQDNIFYVGIDVSKAKHAVAIAEGGRGGEVRYFGAAFPERRHRNVVAVKPNRDGPVIMNKRHLASHRDRVAFGQFRHRHRPRKGNWTWKAPSSTVRSY
ncbi:hypothetical protein NKH49_33985 [Mesorhizobium sp. M1088]